jgi:putative transcriptional regulator
MAGNAKESIHGKSPCKKLFLFYMETTSPEDISGPLARDRLNRLSSGAVLLARDVLQDPNFIATVVLVCIYAKEGGAYGLVLNRPSHMPLSELFDGFSGRSVSREICVGGPVQQDELQILQITDTPKPEAFKVAPRLYLGGKWFDVDQMLGQEQSSALLFLGYSGWAAGQLEGEIEAGAWEVHRVNLEELLLNPQRIVGASVTAIASFLESIAL